MSTATLKPFLVILAVGLLAVVAQWVLLPEGTRGTESLAAYFDRLVEECRQAHPEWGRDVCARIARGDFWIGMTAEMALASLGEPTRVEPSQGDEPAYEDWTYHTGRYGAQVLRFEDGILVSSRLANPDCPACQVRQPEN